MHNGWVNVTQTATLGSSQGYNGGVRQRPMLRAYRDTPPILFSVRIILPENSPLYYIKNWWKFQHYKDRRPPWIKLHRSIETDPAFQSLNESDQWRVVRLWLVASDMDGTLPSRKGYVRATLRLGNDHQEVTLLARLVEVGLISQQDIRGRREDAASSSQRKRQSREESTTPPTPQGGIYVPTLTPEDIAHGIKIINGKRFNPGVGRQIN